MKKIVITFIAALALTTIMPVGIAGATGYHGSTNTNTTKCLDAKDASSYVTTFTRGTGTISTKNGTPLCEAADIVLESFTLPDTWNGKNFNETAIPQTMFAVTPLSIPANQANFSKTLKVDVPAVCKHTQLDFYFSPEYKAIKGLHDDDGRYIHGVIFGKTAQTCETPKPTPTPTSTPTPTPTATPKPTPTSTPKPVEVKKTTNEAKPAALPNTGIEGAASLFGVTTALGTAVAYLKQRFNRQ